MSPPPIARDSDIERLREEGFDLEVRSTYLLLKDVPYVTGQREVRRGVLISTLERNESRRAADTCRVLDRHPSLPQQRAQLAAFCNPSPAQSLGDGIQADHTFSAKAPYRDFHHKMTTYIARIEGEAQVIDADSQREDVSAARRR